MTASKQKARVVSWDKFYVDHKVVLLKTTGLDAVVKLCYDRGLNNSIPDKEQTKTTVLFLRLKGSRCEEK